MTRQEFEYYIPSAVMPNDELFERITDCLEQGEREASRLLGPELYAAVRESGHTDDELRDYYRRLVCLWAYRAAIAHLDLVLTPTGFGVVSNQNVAPASMERVNRLRSTVTNALEDTIDNIIDHCRGNELWQETEIAKSLFTTVVWNARRQLFYMGVPDGHRSKMDELRPKISAAEEKIKHCVSPEFFAEICTSIRCATLTAEQNTVLHHMLLTISAEVTGDMGMARMFIKKLVQYLDENIRTFPTYANSTAYAANTFEPYQNQKDDATYFFG